MLKLFKFEFRKLFQSKSFWICTIISILYIFLPALADKINKVNTSRYVLVINSIPGLFFPILMGVFIAIFVTEDDETGAIKTLYAKGYNRTKVFISKYLVSLCGILLIVIFTMLVAYLFGLIAWNNDTYRKDKCLEIVSKKIMIVIAYHSVFFAITSFFSKIAPSVTLNILSPFIVSIIVSLIEAIYENNVKGKVLNLNKYELASMLLDGDTDVNVYLVCIVYIVVFACLGYLFNRRKEV